MSAASVSLSRQLVILALLFFLALIPRFYGAQSVGWDWDYSGSFTLINFDEGGSCRASLRGFDYSTFIGRQTIAIAGMLGDPPAKSITGNPQEVKAYCHSAGHILAARSYSAVTGALTVVLVGVIGLLLYPARPQIAWTAALLLALSGVHASESHSGTVDAPSTFFIYAFILALVYGVSRKQRWVLLVSPLLLVMAVWAKYWVFAVVAYAALIPAPWVSRMTGGISRWRLLVLMFGAVIVFALATHPQFRDSGWYPVLAGFYLLVPWRSINRGMAVLLFLVPWVAVGLAWVDVIAAYTTGGAEGRFGASYASIGWNKWLRNPFNLVTFLLVGIGLPACLFLPGGVRAIFSGIDNRRAWWCFSPVLLFFGFMLFVSPITYYRHYLPLLPAAALLAAIGFWSSRWSQRRWVLPVMALWSALLLIDIEADYHHDPRLALRGWYDEHPQAKVFVSFYVSPPAGAGASSKLFRPEYARGDAAPLQQGDYLILSENWYDTSFANELNGPYVGNLDRLVKTTPEYATFYRQALSGAHPYLEREVSYDVDNFMPELLFHSGFYGTFQLFVGDLKVLRIKHD